MLLAVFTFTSKKKKKKKKKTSYGSNNLRHEQFSKRNQGFCKRLAYQLSFTNVHNEFKTKLRKTGGDFIVHSSRLILHNSHFTLPSFQTSHFTVHTSQFTLHSFLKRYFIFKRQLKCHFKVHNSWMDDLRFHRQFNSISVISGRWKGEHERLCAMKRRLGKDRILRPAWFEPETPRSQVRSANCSATRLLQFTVLTS